MRPPINFSGVSFRFFLNDSGMPAKNSLKHRHLSCPTARYERHLLHGRERIFSPRWGQVLPASPSSLSPSVFRAGNPYCASICAAGEKTSRNGPRYLLSVDQSVTANTTSEKRPLKSVSRALRKSTAVRCGSFPNAPQPHAPRTRAPWPYADATASRSPSRWNRAADDPGGARTWDHQPVWSEERSTGTAPLPVRVLRCETRPPGERHWRS